MQTFYHGCETLTEQHAKPHAKVFHECSIKKEMKTNPVEKVWVTSKLEVSANVPNSNLAIKCVSVSDCIN